MMENGSRDDEGDEDEEDWLSQGWFRNFFQRWCDAYRNGQFV